MIEKIFTKLKQGYSHLGLGDAILRSHAENLAALGFVTDENIDTVVDGQKGFLENLQKANDNRVTEAVEKARKKAEEEAKKRAEDEAKKREDEAKKKAEDERKKAEAEARKKAEEEAERKRKEELEKSTDIPQWFKDKQAQAEILAKQAQEERDAKIAALIQASTENQTKYDKIIKALSEDNKALKESFAKMTEEAESAKIEKAKRQRSEMILNKAKELGIPQSRIDEGFAIAEDATEESVASYLKTVAQNAKASQLPTMNKYTMGNVGEVSKEEVDNIAKLLVK